MRITEVRITPMERGDCPDRMLGFVAFTIDGAFAVKNARLIAGDDGPFLAFPQYERTDRCPDCNHRTPLRDHFCGRCGSRLAVGRCERRPDGKPDAWRDVAHPIAAEARAAITAAVVAEYNRAMAEALAAEAIPA